ncbi:MAG: GGDEF domain-containing protein [Phycisphaerales bacterium]|nr:GGDEF domain-containing protein [Phycisphaerales bacterium]
MDTRLLESILNCSRLPSLPAVALRVIELTRDQDVAMSELASTIESDQGLSAKILKTVNSSFYGLRQPCSNIKKALVLLGLGPVKSLALGFSLVSSIEIDEKDGFPYTAYWRRALYTAAASRLVAVKCCPADDPDALFLAGLLQDIGMLAMHRALGDEYLAVLEESGHDHRHLARHELNELDIQHPDIGAMLAQRWKLPDELQIPVKYHERPTAAPPRFQRQVRCVGLGNMLHDVLSDADPAPALRRVYAKGGEWFGLNKTGVDEIVKKLTESVRELSGIFRLDTGEHPDPVEILQDAGRRLEELSRADPIASCVSRHIDACMVQGGETDPLTGVLNRNGFESAARSAFHLTRSKGSPLGLVIVAIDRFKEHTKVGPEGLEGEIALGVTSSLDRRFGPSKGVVCRLGSDLFAVIVDGLERGAVTELAEGFRSELERYSSQWLVPDYPGELRVTASVGIAVADGTTAELFSTPDLLIASAMRAALASRQAGGNTVRAFAPAKRAA